MNNFQKIKNMVADAKTPEELSWVLATIPSELKQACLYNTDIGNCDKDTCGKYTNNCCALGLISYLKTESEKATDSVGNIQECSDWDYVKDSPIGSVLEVPLKNGDIVEFEKVHTRAGISFFLLKDLWKDVHHIDYSDINVSYPDSEVNWWLNNKVINMLPDDLVERILPKKIAQTIDDESCSTTCKLWLPSVIEVFGKDNWSADTVAIEPVSKEQFELFKRDKNFIKNFHGVPAGWWLRTPFIFATANYWYINPKGVCYNASSTNSAGIAFGFCL